ncbi:ankyrin repeat domain-containing protein [bacterium]|nr:ankyrin repeat domain-containing protein [bacterium]MDB4341845.1 ankyrin repeat domain-containing protein [bacterium]
MKHLLLTTIAAVLVVGCGDSQQSAPAPEAKPEATSVEPVAEALQQAAANFDLAEYQYAKPETPTAKAPEISIHKAAGEGNIEAVKQHIAAGTDVNEKDDSEWTPLHRAALGGNKEIAELLIDKGAEVNAQSDGGWTPLHLGGTKEVAALLIENGADVNAKANDGFTPLDLAIGGNHKETADLLRKHGGKTAKPSISIYEAAIDGNIEAVKQHLTAGTDVDGQEEAGGTPLHSAALFDHLEVVKLLIAEGADVNAKSEGGGTPLHIAASKGHKEMAELLITAGADVNAKDGGGNTPLDWAIKYKRTEIADLLRKHGGKTGEEFKAEGE